jgi:trk system potassium uptake protein TrkA
MFILVVGGGKVGSYLTRALLDAGHEVVVVEKNERKARMLERLVDRQVAMVGDGCDPIVLESAGLARADVVVADTGDDEDNLVVALLTKKKSKARCIARVNNPRNRQIFASLDSKDPVAVISSTEIILDVLQEYVNAASNGPAIETLHLFGKGDLRLVKIAIPDQWPLTGKPLSEVRFPHGSVVVAINRPQRDFEVPTGDTVLQQGDEIIAIVKSGVADRIFDLFAAPAHQM